jgi:2-polyprenyl-3-methyl-5-hydroxy-6-metoxy-1,4-benzoquinol methylase
MSDLTNQPCPICGQTHSQVVHHTTYPEHQYPGTFTLRRCDGCGLLFNSPRLGPDELANLYGKNYYFFQRGDAREFDRIVGMYQRTVALIESQVAARRCIDIGCGRGYFPALLKELGWDASGIEISADAAQSAREKFGLDIFTGTVEQYASSPGAKRFPLVTAIDVIEHVPRPDEFVASAAKIVEAGGWLVIDTPNAAARNIEHKAVAWKGFNPFHIYLFTIENLTTLLKRHGMTVSTSFSYGNTETSRGLRDRAIAMLKATGLLRPAVTAYFGIKKLTTRNAGGAGPHIAAAVSKVKSDLPFTQTVDHGGPLAATCSGDNIVVVARKS